MCTHKKIITIILALCKANRPWHLLNFLKVTREKSIVLVDCSVDDAYVDDAYVLAELSALCIP